MKAIVELSSQSVLDVVPDNQGTALPAGQVYMRLVDYREPFDSATHKEKFVGYVVTGAKVFRRYLSEPMTQQEIYDLHLAAGFLDATTGIKLKTTEYAQAKFTQLVTLLSTALSAGAVQATDQQVIFDFDDHEHALTVTDLLGLLLRYGTHCATLFRNYAP